MATVHLVFGPLGAGKSTLARQLARQCNAVRFSIDEWMHELYDDDRPPALSLSWVLARVRRCESRIWHTCAAVLATGRDAVLDLGFLAEADRARFRGLAREAGHQACSHFVDAGRELRWQRIERRNRDRSEGYSFEVTRAMFELMDARFERPGAQELAVHGDA